MCQYLAKDFNLPSIIIIEINLYCCLDWHRKQKNKLKHTIKTNHNICFKILLNNYDKTNNHWICTYIVEHYNNLDLLKYAHENEYPWDEQTCNRAAANGHFECLKYTHENGCPWNAQTCEYVAIYGNLECLKYAHDNGCPWDEQTCKYAAYN